MFKKNDLEEFLFLWSKAEKVPFTNYEDSLSNNYSALDKPFKDYSQLVSGCHNYLKVEISENLLLLTSENRKIYLEYLKNRIENETWIQSNVKLIGLLKTLNIKTDSLNYKDNKKLYDALNLSFNELSSRENLAKHKQLHREYYLFLLNTERNGLIEYLKDLNVKEHSFDNTYKDEDWFKFGVQLAAGKLRKYYDVNSKNIFVTKREFSGRGIAKELGFEKINNTISGTFNNYLKGSSNSNRNIFNDPSKILRIKKYCDKNNITIVSEFSKRILKE